MKSSAHPGKRMKRPDKEQDILGKILDADQWFHSPGYKIKFKALKSLYHKNIDGLSSKRLLQELSGNLFTKK